MEIKNLQELKDQINLNKSKIEQLEIELNLRKKKLLVLNNLLLDIFCEE